MSKEEKAIQYFKSIKKGLENNGQEYWSFNTLNPKEIETIINLIEKQQKEIDELKTNLNRTKCNNCWKEKKFEKEINKHIKTYYKQGDLICELTDKAEKQQKEISILRYSLYNEREREKDMIHTDRIREKIKELEEQQEKLKYDGNVCYADYEQFCKNLNFLKEQVGKLLEEE